MNRSEPISGKDFIWNLSISGASLNNGDNDRTLEIHLLKFKSNGSHNLKGSFQTNGNELKTPGKTWNFGEKLKCQLVKAFVRTKYTFLGKCEKPFHFLYTGEVHYKAAWLGAYKS